MSPCRHILFFGLALAFAIGIAACSDDDSNPQESQPPPGAESPVGHSGGNSSPAEADSAAQAGSRSDSDEFAIVEDNAHFLSSDLAQAYRERCLDKRRGSRECELLRSLVVVETVAALEEIERSRDQRGAEQALVALQLDQEPEILVAAMRILGRFPETQGIAEKVSPLLLESPYLQVQQMAAQLLASNPNPTLAAVGAYWSGNHSTLYADDPYQEYPDFAPHYLAMDFPDYADAEWFSPADSDRSVGWWTEDDFATVSARLAEELGVEGLTFRDWAQHLSQESQAMFQVDPDKQAEVQRLIEEWTKTQNMAVLEKMQKLQEELYAPAQAAGEIADKGVGGLGPAMAPDAQDLVRFYIAEERAGHVARLVIAYPLTSLGRTVIQHAWNLTYYPGAWPPLTEDAVREQ
jgi:hypothetical protein